jgi:hypothetical protein
MTVYNSPIGAYAARMDDWVAWETVEGAAPRGEG